MKNLIIIGNGFDLAHGLKTDYASFIADIRKDQNKYGLKDISTNYVLRNLALQNETDTNWSDIESFYFDMLTKISKDKINPNVTLKSIEELNRGFNEVKKFLAQYLHEQEQHFEKNENYNKFFNHFNNKDTVVLNFNYTQTVKEYLKSYSNIELIHIHGELDGDKESEENPMIFGYAANDEESKRLLDENNSKFVRNIKKFNYLFTGNEARLKYNLGNGSFKLYILGHSCGLSDKLILNQILNAKDLKKIYPFYYKDRDGYFETMVNINRIIDDYSKYSDDEKSFPKLCLFHESFKMPQQVKVEGFEKFLQDAKNCNVE